MNLSTLDLSCPRCGSENTQKLSLAVQAGTSTVTTASALVGGSSGHFGQGLAITGGTSASQLAKEYAEPRRKMVFLPILLALPAAAFLALFHWFIGLVILMPFLLKGWVNFSYNRMVQPQRHAEWNAKFICLRCANVFQPEG